MKVLLIFIFLILTLVNRTYALETVRVQESIKIFSNIHRACEFISNPLNDHLWRTEVNRITENGNIYTEDAWIGIRKNFITLTELIHSKCPEYSTFLTIPENLFYLRSHRSFSYISEKETLFTYTVDFDVQMIKETFGFKARPKTVSYLYSILMRSYLRKLSILLSEK